MFNLGLSVFGAERSFFVVCRRLRGNGLSGRAGALQCGGRRRASTALRCSVARAGRATRCAHFVRATQTLPPKSAHEARCARSPVALCSSAPHRRAPTRPDSPLQHLWWHAIRRTPRSVARGWRHPAGAISGATRSGARTQTVLRTVCAWRRTGPPGPGAGLQSARASALRNLTCRICPNAANEVSVVSYAARLKVEHRSAVDAQRRPPQHELPAGAASRDALSLAQSGLSRTTEIR